MNKSYFPHFYRIIAAPLLFVSILTLTLLNLFHSGLFGFNEEKKLKMQIMSQPEKSSFHEELGQLYINSNRNRASDEYLLAEEYYNVLGMETRPEDKWNAIINQNKGIYEELYSWQNIAKLNPDYYFAKLKIAALYSELGKTTESRSLLDNLSKNPAFDLNLSF